MKNQIKCIENISFLLESAMKKLSPDTIKIGLATFLLIFTVAPTVSFALIPEEDARPAATPSSAPTEGGEDEKKDEEGADAEDSTENKTESAGEDSKDKEAEEKPKEDSETKAEPRESTTEKKTAESESSQSKADNAEKEKKEGEPQTKPSTDKKEAKTGSDTKADVKKEAEAKKKEKTDGWFPKLKASLTTSMVHNKNLPGIDDGLSLTIGVLIDGELKYNKGPHRWITTLKIEHTQSKTPTLEPFFKTADELDFKSLYEHSFKKYNKLMVFGGGQIIATLFPGHVVVSEDTELRKLRTDSTEVAGQAMANEPYEISPGLSPFSFKQLVGFGVTPSEDPFAKLNIRLSMVAQETWARGYAVDDDEDTPELELRELQNFQQVGPQFNLTIDGEIKKKLKYSFNAEMMFPVYTSIDTDLSGFNLLNTDLEFKLGVEVNKWASFNYVFTAKRQPMILDEWQILNNLVFTVTANIL